MYDPVSFAGKIFLAVVVGALALLVCAALQGCEFDTGGTDEAAQNPGGACVGKFIIDATDTGRCIGWATAGDAGSPDGR